MDASATTVILTRDTLIRGQLLRAGAVGTVVGRAEGGSRPLVVDFGGVVVQLPEDVANTSWVEHAQIGGPDTLAGVQVFRDTDPAPVVAVAVVAMPVEPSTSSSVPPATPAEVPASTPSKFDIPLDL